MNLLYSSNRTNRINQFYTEFYGVGTVEPSTDMRVVERRQNVFLDTCVFIAYRAKELNNWLKLFEQFNELSNLSDGWDSYDAPAPNSQSIESASSFLELLRPVGLEPTNIGPSVMGGVGFTFGEGKRIGFVEFYNEGDACAILSDGDSDPITKDVSLTGLGFQSIIADVQDYLNGRHPGGDEATDQ